MKWVSQLSLVKIAASALEDKLIAFLEKGSCEKEELEKIRKNIGRVINGCSKLEKDEDCPVVKKTLAKGIKQIAGTMLSTLDGLTVVSGQLYINRLKDIDYLRVKLAKETEPIEIE